MKAALLFFTALPLAAQLEILTVTGPVNQEQPVTGLVAMGSTATGEPLDRLIRIRNTGPTLAVLQTLTLQGTGFVLHQAPTLGPTGIGLVSGFSLDFFVRFTSETAVTDARANLRINTTTITLLATATAAPILYQVEEDGARTRRFAQQSTVFPPTERGSQSTRRFLLENPHDRSLTVSEFMLSGENFRLNSTIISPFTMNARQSIEFVVAFAPRTSGLKAERLSIDGRVYGLEGVGRDPVLPRPQLRVPESLGSGQQTSIQVIFEPAPPVDSAGILTIDFQTTIAGPDDPALAFLNGNRRSIPFQIKAGQREGLFNNQKEALLQTGTTAGTIRFQADAGGFRTEVTRPIPPVEVKIDSLTAQRGLDLLQVTLIGFDNTRSASEVTFTFYDASGAVVPPGQLKADIALPVRQYFQTTTSGGTFRLAASFRATASTTSISAAEVEFRNSAGVSRTERIRF